MPREILFEGYNLGIGQGTGIATYARNLNQAARQAGYSTDVLLNVRTALNRRDATLNEVGFFDVPSAAGFAESLQTAASFLTGSPFGIRGEQLRREGAVVDYAPSEVTGFDHTFGAVKFGDRAYDHFTRYGRRAQLKIAKKYALFHATHPIPLYVENCPNIYTIHDIIPLRLPFATLDNKKYFVRLIRHLCKTADHIVTVSEHSRRDIMQFFGIGEDRITNTYQASEIPQRYLNASQDQVFDIVANAFGLEPEGYFLFVGAIEPKKNLSRLIDAYAASGTKKPLVIVGGSGWQHEKDLEKIRDERFLKYDFSGNTLSPNRQIRHLSYVPFEQLVALIRGCSGLLFPSLYEGFGLPVLEAMQLGAPVMTSNIASLPEVAGDAALLVDPLDLGEMSRAIRKLDQDEDLRKDLRARGKEQAQKFSAENYQKKIAELYRRILG